MSQEQTCWFDWSCRSICWNDVQWLEAVVTKVISYCTASKTQRKYTSAAETAEEWFKSITYLTSHCSAEGNWFQWQFIWCCCNNCRFKYMFPGALYRFVTVCVPCSKLRYEEYAFITVKIINNKNMGGVNMHTCSLERRVVPIIHHSFLLYLYRCWG